MKIAVLALAYGGPDTLDDLPEYLTRVRGGRPASSELLAEMRERYAHLGGCSPLLRITCTQAAALERALSSSNGSNGDTYRVYVGMRHWQPTIDQAVCMALSDHPDAFIAFCMAPHASRWSTGAYRQAVDTAMDRPGVRVPVAFVPSWYNLPALIDVWANNVRDAMGKFDPGAAVHVFFTAHSLPLAALAQDDPYPAQVAETARLVAARAGLPDGSWSVCYQSATPGAAWLGPALDDCIAHAAESGKRDLLVAPIGFVSDHVEVLYDLDVAARELALQHGARLERAASLNDSEAVAQGLAGLVREQRTHLG
jgi:ferrochelatase